MKEWKRDSHHFPLQYHFLSCPLSRLAVWFELVNMPFRYDVFVLPSSQWEQERGTLCNTRLIHFVSGVEKNNFSYTRQQQQHDALSVSVSPIVSHERGSWRTRVGGREEWKVHDHLSLCTFLASFLSYRWDHFFKETRLMMTIMNTSWQPA